MPVRHAADSSLRIVEILRVHRVLGVDLALVAFLDPKPPVFPFVLDGLRAGAQAPVQVPEMIAGVPHVAAIAAGRDGVLCRLRRRVVGIGGAGFEISRARFARRMPNGKGKCKK
jgi:hypothetical protein